MLTQLDSPLTPSTQLDSPCGTNAHDVYGGAGTTGSDTTGACTPMTQPMTQLDSPYGTMHTGACTPMTQLESPYGGAMQTQNEAESEGGRGGDDGEIGVGGTFVGGTPVGTTLPSHFPSQCSEPPPHRPIDAPTHQ